MSKHYAISIIVSIVVVSIFVATMFLIMLPQVESLSSEVISEYTRINSEEYEFVETKQVVKEILSQKHIVTNDDITSYEKNHLYNPGNSDPFTPKDALNTEVQNSNNQNAQQQNNNSNNGKPIVGTNK